MTKYTKEQKELAYQQARDISTYPAAIEVLADYTKYMLYNSNTPDGEPAIKYSYQDMNAAYGSWSIPGMLAATRRMIDRAGEDDFMIDVYSKEEAGDDEEMKNVKLFWFPAGYETDENGNKHLINADKPFILAISGGAYTSLCNLSEAFPAAASFNELGYNVFAFDYRVNESDITSEDAATLFPKPLDDTAAALKYIFSHLDDFGLKTKEYVVTGFSAGASLTVQWGVQSHGYPHYSLPKPAALFPIYPAVDNRIMYAPTYDSFNRIMFGPHYTEETLSEYAVQEVMTKDYPPCFIVHSINDSMVPVFNSCLLNDKLEEFGIPHVMENPRTAGHGFGNGMATDAEDWPQRAIRFLEAVMNNEAV